MSNIQLTQDLIKSLFYYKDGFLYKKTNIDNPQSEKPLGCFDKKIGYYRIWVNGKLCLTHRIIFLFHKGYLPEIIDHIDKNQINNKIENLREATKSQNNANCKKRVSLYSKYKGVTFMNKKGKQWMSQIRHNSKTYYLGVYDTEEQAAEAYNKACVIKHGEFGSPNVIEYNPDIVKV